MEVKTDYKPLTVPEFVRSCLLFHLLCASCYFLYVRMCGHFKRLKKNVSLYTYVLVTCAVGNTKQV